MAVTVETGARLHFGFLNVSPRRDRLFGSLGAGVDRPLTRITAEPAPEVTCSDDEVAAYAAAAVDLLDVPGVSIDVVSSPPRHAGFGSGTQLALATLVAVAEAHDRPVNVRDAAPGLGRGRRSGVGVATFKQGGFIFDAGREREATALDESTERWIVPPVVMRRPLPSDWRFVTVLPDVERGVTGAAEDRSIERVMAQANPAIADRIAAIVVGEVLPALATENVQRFGHGLSRIDQLNGLWFRPEQAGGYHPVVRPAVESLEASPAICGVGQSSWGPAVYGVTSAERVEAATSAAYRGLDRIGVPGAVLVLRPRNAGAAIIAGNE